MPAGPPSFESLTFKVIPFHLEAVSPCGTAFRCISSLRPGTRPRRATFFFVVRQIRRQESVPRCRAPFGGSLLPAMPGGVFANSPCGLKHAKPSFRPSSPPVGTPEGRGNAGDQRPVPDSSSAGARCIRKARSAPAEQRTSRRGLPARLSEPEGRVPRRPPAGSSAGQSAAGRPGVAGRLPSLLTFLAKQESQSPAGGGGGVSRSMLRAAVAGRVCKPGRGKIPANITLINRKPRALRRAQRVGRLQTVESRFNRLRPAVH